MRRTLSTALVLRQFLDAPDAPRYGLDLIRATGLKSGSLYPILGRLNGAGWVTREWETLDPVAAGRPPRCFYRLTPEGREAAADMLAALSKQLRLS